jgi:hypothetical protein
MRVVQWFNLVSQKEEIIDELQQQKTAVLSAAINNDAS